ncbi:unnamed protein product, partial [Urochloa humidicola]
IEHGSSSRPQAAARARRAQCSDGPTTCRASTGSGGRALGARCGSGSWLAGPAPAAHAGRAAAGGVEQMKLASNSSTGACRRGGAGARRRRRGRAGARQSFLSSSSAPSYRSRRPARWPRCRPALLVVREQIGCNLLFSEEGRTTPGDGGRRAPVPSVVGRRRSWGPSLPAPTRASGTPTSKAWSSAGSEGEGSTLRGSPLLDGCELR